LPEASPEEWAQAVESVLTDGALRSRLSAQALANAARPELDPECIADRFLEVAAAHVARCRA
jgi:glycosyltransferase involved in cell wall biosynthesis